MRRRSGRAPKSGSYPRSANQVRQALDRLDSRCRDLLTMLYGDADEAAAYDQIAARLDMPVGSIGPTRARCLGKLRKLVA